MPIAFYNEHDKNAAAWLREIIKSNLIAPGVVDERSIIDIRPADLEGYTQCHFFAGIGTWSHALRAAGWPDARPVWTGSPPCQPFSTAGKQLGADDIRHLAPHFLELIRECRPSVVFGEQVASAASGAHGWWADDLRTNLEAEGYAFGMAVLGAHSVGSPHIRQRLYFVGQLVNASDSRCEGNISREVRGGRDEAAGEDERATGSSHALLVADSRRELTPSWQFNKPVIVQAERELPASVDQRCGESDVLVADAEHAGQCGAGWPTPEPHSDEPDERVLDGDCRNPADRLMAYAREARPQELLGRREQPEGHPATRGPLYGMAQSESQRLQEHGVRESGIPLHTGATGPLYGFWADADWLPCRDGKWRPTGPGISPLVRRLADDNGGGCVGAKGEPRRDEAEHGLSAEQVPSCSTCPEDDDTKRRCWEEDPQCDPDILADAKRERSEVIGRACGPGEGGHSGDEDLRPAPSELRGHDGEEDGDRIPQPGSEPLADGSACGVGRGGDPGAPWDEGGEEEAMTYHSYPFLNTSEARVMRLKGYGNAICSPLAQLFIECFLEATDET